MSEIIEQTKLITNEDAQKVKEEFEKQSNIIKGDCFEGLLDNIDKNIGYTPQWLPEHTEIVKKTLKSKSKCFTVLEAITEI